MLFDPEDLPCLAFYPKLLRLRFEGLPQVLLSAIVEMQGCWPRLFRGTDVERQLMACPTIVTAVSCNRRLSLW